MHRFLAHLTRLTLLCLMSLLPLAAFACGGRQQAAPVMAYAAISIAPKTALIRAGETQQFTAEGTASDGTKTDVTKIVKWSSSDRTVATIDAGGLAVGVSDGTATIAAESGGIKATATLTVANHLLVTIQVTPATTSATKQAFHATGNYADETTEDLTSKVKWSSSDTTIATIDATGLATGIKVGTTTITAEMDGLKGTATVTVPSIDPVSLDVTPATAKVSVGAKQAFKATVTYNDGTTADVTASVFWSTDKAVVATIGASTGIATGLGVGDATVMATLAPWSGTAKLTVFCAKLKSIDISAPASIAVGETVALSVVATCTDCITDYPCSPPPLTWIVDDPTILSIDSTNSLTGLKPGTTTFSLGSGPVVGKKLTITVTP